MNRTVLALALAVTAAASIVPGSPATREAHAASLQRCLAPDGSTLYTDQPCALHDATPIAMPGELSARLVDAWQAEMDAGGSGGTLDGATAYVDASVPLYPASQASVHAVARRSVADGCARSPTQLAMDLQGAFALGDVNRIAESYHWVGMDQQAATGVMQRLERMARSSVVDTQFFDATIASAGFGAWAAAGDMPAPDAGILQLALGGEGGHQVLDLAVERYEGCYFVSF